MNVCPDGEILPDNEICGDKQVCLGGRCESMCATASGTTVGSDCHCEDHTHGVCQVCCLDVVLGQCITMTGGVSNFTDGLSCPMGICKSGVCLTDFSLSRKTPVDNEVTNFTVLAVIVVLTPCVALIMVMVITIRAFGFTGDILHILRIDTKQYQDPTVIYDKSKRRKTDAAPLRHPNFHDKMRRVSTLEKERTATKVRRKTFL